MLCPRLREVETKRANLHWSHKCVFLLPVLLGEVMQVTERIVIARLAGRLHNPPLRFPPCGGFYFWWFVVLAVTSLILVVGTGIQLLVACRYLCTKGCSAVNGSITDLLRAISALLVVPFDENGAEFLVASG